MSLHRVSVAQALDVWSDLARAYYGDNGYGSDTAEIYAYRISALSPSLHLPGKDGTLRLYEPGEFEARRRNSEAMVDLLWEFQREFDCDITVRGETFDWEPLCDWIKEQGFSHRWHIRVTPKVPIQKVPLVLGGETREPEPISAPGPDFVAGPPFVGQAQAEPLLEAVADALRDPNPSDKAPPESDGETRE